MNNTKIVKASSSNIDDIFKISSLSFPIPWSKKSVENEILNNSNAHYLVAIKNDNVIGYAGIWKVLDEAQITNIAILPEYRNLGIGFILLKSLINLCKTINIKDITLEVRKSNFTAQNLYKKLGFIEEGIRKNYYVDNREDALIMWKHNI